MDVHFEAVHYPENEAAGQASFRLPYAVLLGTFHGDWFTAAERYRRWAVRQSWAEQSRVRRGLVPDWARQTGVWVWNRGRSEGVLPPAAALQKELGLPVRVFWHWWHGCPYDTGFPEYFPPREGAAPFQAALSRAHEQDLRAIVYMNQRLWGTTTKSWRDENAEPFAVKSAEGKIHQEVYNIFTRQPCAPMCLGTEFWRGKYAALAQKALDEFHLDGIYMDQACASLPCYYARHGHPVGGGNYWIKGFASLSEEIRKRSAHRPIALAGEGCGEAWLPYLDLMLTLQVSKERYTGPNDPWEVIPLFQAVYHPYAITYGSYSSLTMPPYDELWPAEFAPKESLALLDRKFSRQFYLEQARALVWGQQPTIANFLPSHLRERAEEVGYVMRLARVRHRAAKYLAQGEFLRPPPIAAPEATSEFSRLSIYAGQKDRLKSHRKRHPLALVGAWRAPDGGIGVALANIGDGTLRIPLTLDRRAYPLPPSGTIHRIDDAGRTRIGQFDREDLSLVVDLPPLAAWVVEFSAPPRSP